MSETKSICCYCGVGCGVIIETQNGQISGVRGDPDHPANFGQLCSKGASLHLTMTPQALARRALYPELRHARSESRSRLSWDHALEHAAQRFAETIERHGPDSVAFYLSGQLLTEDYYVFNKLARALIGTNNVDSNSRLCMSSAATAYTLTLGADAPPSSYADIELADCVFIAGSNTADAHPILFRRLAAAKQARPEMKIIVVDPRRTATAEFADLHLPILPGSDIALYNAMLNVMLSRNLCDRDFIAQHTEGFDSLSSLTLREYTAEHAAELCGIPVADIVQAACWFAGSDKTLSLYCQGLNQSVHGTHNNAALIHLHLASGKIGKPGCGPLSLTGQSNAMGGREVGAMATLLAGHRDLRNPEHRAEMARLWGIEQVPERPGKTAIEIFSGLNNGSIKALWIVCSNPAQSLPDLNLMHDALQAAEFIVVQDAYAHTDTTAYADLLLPASSWGEKEGCVTNSERRISHIRPAIAAPGEARADWRIGVDFAHRLGEKLGKGALAQRLFPYEHVEQIFTEHRATTSGRDLDISGLSYALLDAQGGQQWPYPVAASYGQQRLYTDGGFASQSGRARFIPVRHQSTAEMTDATYPLHFTTGRLRDQWHGMSRTGNVARLFQQQSEPQLDMHADDMLQRHLQDGDLVRLKGLRGSLILRVQASTALRRGQTFMAMHWGEQFMHGLGANAITVAAVDPLSKQAELKHAAVEVEKFNTTYAIVAMRRAPPDAPDDHPAAALALLARLQPWLQRFDYATLTLTGHTEPVLVFSAFLGAAAGNPDTAMLTRLDHDLGLDDASQMQVFNDPRRSIFKRALIEGEVLTGIRLAGETAARSWLQNLMSDGAAATPLRPWLLAPLADPPAGTKLRGRVVCNCFNTAECDILADITAGLDLSALQLKHKCGTSCGSCLNELKRLTTLPMSAAA